MIELHNDISKFIEHTLDEVKQYFITYKNIEFHKTNIQNGAVYNVYESKIIFIAHRLSSYEIKEKGIILEENNEFRYYNFEENYENKEEIIKKFVEKYYLG